MVKEKKKKQENIPFIKAVVQTACIIHRPKYSFLYIFLILFCMGKQEEGNPKDFVFSHYILKLYPVHWRVNLNQYIRNIGELTNQHLNIAQISLAQLQPSGMSWSFLFLEVFLMCQVSISSLTKKSTNMPHISRESFGGLKKEIQEGKYLILNGLFNTGHSYFPVSFLLQNLRWLQIWEQNKIRQHDKRQS